jgi:hypothetical protein
MVLPKLDENNNYYYDLLIGLNKNGDIQDFLNLNLDIIKINGIEQLSNKITYKFFQSLFDFKNIIFKDCAFNKVETNLIDIHEKLKLTTEYIEHQSILKQCIEYEGNRNASMYLSLDLQEEKLQKEVSKKYKELFDFKLQTNITFRKLCYHLYYYTDIF